MAVRNYPVKGKTNDLLKLKYWQSDFIKIMFKLTRSSYFEFLFFPLHRVSFFGFGS